MFGLSAEPDSVGNSYMLFTELPIAIIDFKMHFELV